MLASTSLVIASYPVRYMEPWFRLYCMAESTDESQFEADSCIRGYHEYKAIGTADVGDTLSWVREPTNAIDRCAVAGSTFVRTSHESCFASEFHFFDN